MSLNKGIGWGKPQVVCAPKYELFKKVAAISTFMAPLANKLPQKPPSSTSSLTNPSPNLKKKYKAAALQEAQLS